MCLVENNNKIFFTEVLRMENFKDLENTLAYIHSELNRIETMAGTLATVERDHYNKLTNFDHRELTDIAVEEQNAARQLGTMQHMCSVMAQKIEGIKKALERGELKGSAESAKIH
jgi:anti-sigma28 factor (negative regulator of flagellin synthesis)